MGEQLSKRQREIYNFIHDFREKYKFYPTYQEIGECFGAAHQTIQMQIQRMIKKGYLERPQNVQRVFFFRKTVDGDPIDGIQ
jgi:SOS-response transcriptional repressor LexA